ncbi:MAG: ADP-ribosylation factor-like protein [Candidatus Helarchaeota archaeon]
MVNGKLPDLDVKAIQGIDEVYGKKLNELGISTIKDLAACDIQEVAKKTKIPLHKIIEFRKKARLVRELIFFESFIKKLAEKNYTIQQAIEIDIEDLKKLTGESEKRCLDFLQQLAIITLILDANVCNSTSTAILQTQPYVSEIPLPEETCIAIDEIADQVFLELPAKIAIIGASGVGKSTITALVQNEKVPEKHIPTITCDVDEIVIGGAQNIYLHDTGGQEQFGFLWGRWVKGADGIVLVVDSTKENLKESKFFIELIQKETPKASVVIIANKQDLPGALSPEEIEKELGYKTYPMVAIDRNRREELLTIFANLIKLSPRLTNLIPTQVKQDTVIKEQEREIEITPELEKQIDDVQKEIDAIDKQIAEIKEKIKAQQELGEPFYKLNADLLVAKLKKRKAQQRIRALLMAGGESKVLAYDVHQEMRNVTYVIRCECGHIYKTLAKIKRGLKKLELICPLCQTKFEVPKNTWKELYLAAFPD